MKDISKVNIFNLFLAIILILTIFSISWKFIVIIVVLFAFFYFNREKIQTEKFKTIANINTKSVQEIKSFVKENNEVNSSLDLPSLKLLNYGKITLESDKSIKAKAKLIVDTLKSININVKFVDFTKNPTIIRLVFSTDNIESRTRISKIQNAIKDLSTALGTRAIKLITVVEGKKNCFALEMPSDVKNTVKLINVINTDKFRELKKSLLVKNFYNGLPIALGIDSDGQELILNLCKAPHVLIAGTTGSGKSVSTVSFIMNLILHHNPKTLNLLMADAKIVELSIFENLPHLIHPLVTNYAGTIELLNIAVTKMQERIELCKNAGVKDIAEYNKKFPEKMIPFIVLIIEEFGEIKLAAPAADKKDETFDTLIARLGQLSRAMGIHLILTCQRPDAKIVSPLIKANMPTRVCFQVTDQTNSRIVIDANGAEALTGKGDGLFYNGGSITRFQNAFQDEDEVKKVIEWWENKKDEKN